MNKNLKLVKKYYIYKQNVKNNRFYFGFQTNNQNFSLYLRNRHC